MIGNGARKERRFFGCERMMGIIVLVWQQRSSLPRWVGKPERVGGKGKTYRLSFRAAGVKLAPGE